MKGKFSVSYTKGQNVTGLLGQVRTNSRTNSKIRVK